MQQAQEGAEADLGRGEVALQVGQEGHLGGQGGRHGIPSPLNNFQKECLVYKALPPADSTVDLLSWWRVHQEQLPLLAHLTRVVMAVPVASSSRQRLFSLSGRLVTPTRNRLDPTKVETIVMIQANLKKLKERELWKFL